MICPANVEQSTVAGKGRGPGMSLSRPGLVGGDCGGRVLFAFGYDLEQQLGFAPVPLQAPQFVDQNHIYAALTVDQLVTEDNR